MFTLFSANLVASASQTLNRVNFSNPTWDIFIILFFITFAFFYGIFLGKDKIVGLIVSIFFAYLLTLNLHFLANIIPGLTSAQFSIFSLIMFIVFLPIIFFLIIKRSVLSSVSVFASSWWQILLFSIIHTGLLISFSLSLLNGELLKVFGPFIKLVFINQQAVFSWVLASILSLILLKQKSE